VARVAALAAAVIALAGCGDGDSGDGQPQPSGLERARTAIRECDVRSVVSLHSGLLYLELKDGGRIELSLDDQRAIYRELERARPRCGQVLIATE
jgi:hypothetical protein